MTEATPRQEIDIFISHQTNEAIVAEALKTAIGQAFGESVRVFVSSDFESLRGGVQWYQAILDALRTCKVIVVLLTDESVSARWINFEAGVGCGAQRPVVPCTFREFPPGEIGHPLSELMARDLSGEAGCRALFQDIEQYAGYLRKTDIDFGALVKHIRQESVSGPMKQIFFEPVLELQPGGEYELCFELVYKGRRAVHLIYVEAAVPDDVIHKPFPSGADGEIYAVSQIQLHDTGYMMARFQATDSSTITRLGVPALPKVLTSSMRCHRLGRPRFSIRREIDVKASSAVLVYHAVVEEFNTGPESTELKCIRVVPKA
jgi:hypothetical protein